MSKPFYLYERKRPGKAPVWYCRFKVNGAIGSPVCTDQTDKSEAERWAYARLIEGGMPRAVTPGKTFEEWARPWWYFDTCPYIREKIANGYNVSKSYAVSRRNYLDKHLIPEFGHYLLSQLKPSMFRDYKMRLYNEGKYAAGTINKIIGTARIMFGYAFTMGEVDSNPLAAVKELKENPVARGIFTMAELAALFGEGALQTVWKGDLRHYALNMIAASMGLRLGECQALRVMDLGTTGFVHVVHSWDDRYGMSPPKWGSSRIIPLPTKTGQAISSLLALKRWGDPLPDDVLFWGRARNMPLTKTGILDRFKNATKRIGIPEEERARRVLLFHSYRHGFNSIVRGKVPDEQLRRVTGHRTVAMSDMYDHPRPEMLADVAGVMEAVFTFKEGGCAKGAPKVD